MSSDLSFRERLVQEFSREELLELLREQDVELAEQVRRIEFVFQKKLRHLSWSDGSPIDGRPVTPEEIALLIDEPFEPSRELSRLGLSIEQQYQVHVAKDNVLWAKHFLHAEPRAYQIWVMRHPKNRRIMRFGRRAGKTYSLALLLLHYAFTNRDGRYLVVAPMKAHVELIYDECMKLAENGEAVVRDAITRHIRSPQFEIDFTNGSIIRFFTSGMKSNNKADVARGQEAHVIILDEFDYMAPEDIDAIYAMLQKTSDNQVEKLLVGASTPTGQKQRFWQWCNSPRFKEFWIPSYCFPPTTSITMSDGSFKNIDKIEVNDLVFTHNGTKQRVTRLFQRRYSGPLVHLIPAGENTGLYTTPNHPILASLPKDSKHNFNWIEAGLLTTDHWVSLFHDRSEQSSNIETAWTYSKLGSVSTYEDTLIVYNFEVEHTNSYIAENIIVHNCNPHWNREIEEEMHEEYTEMVYRHEIEADWGEDVSGVYPRKSVDFAFNQGNWKYIDRPTPGGSFYLIGVDWDKYAAGVNIVVLEACSENHELEYCRGKLRVVYRQEYSKGEYTLTGAVDRVIKLNEIFKPTWIYIDRGYGEVQGELLRKYGVDHPETGLHKKVLGFTFSDSIEVPDPFTKEMLKKRIKPFMVDNLHTLLEQEMILFPEADEDLYLQLISYVVAAESVYDLPRFEMSGNVPDHAHDALILACLAYAQKYGELMKLKLARRGIAISSDVFLPTFDLKPGDEGVAEATWDSPASAPVKFKRIMSARPVGINRPLRRKNF